MSSEEKLVGSWVNISTIDNFYHSYFLVFIYTPAIEHKYVMVAFNPPPTKSLEFLQQLKIKESSL